MTMGKKPMYYRDDREQLTMEEFFQPFGGRLRKDNRWVRLADVMPWEHSEDIYAKINEYVCTRKWAGGAADVDRNDDSEDGDETPCANGEVAPFRCGWIHLFGADQLDQFQ